METVRIYLHSDDQHMVMLKAGTCVIVPFSLYGHSQTLGVARVEAVLKVHVSLCQPVVQCISNKG